MEPIGLRIKEALENVEPWQRVPTSADGVYLVKTPNKSSNSNILVEINPSTEQGKPLKRRGLFLRNKTELEMFINTINRKDLVVLLEGIDDLSEYKPPKKGEVLQI
mgnify:CR=1 FL=1